jgi:nucleoside transporter
MSPRTKFSVMMFLEFFIWGAWLPLAVPFLLALGFDKWWQIALFMNAFAVASITGLFFSNQFADRNFAAEKFLAASHLIGGVSILGIGFIHDYWAQLALPFDEFWAFFGLMLIHSLFYVPTISITNSIAFSNLKDAQREFPLVRLWGTIGWIAASVPFVFILVDWSKIPALGAVPFVDWLGATLDAANAKQGAAFLNGVSYTYVAAGVASLLLAVFSLTLPHTPPKPARASDSSFAWLAAVKLLGQPFMLVLFIATFIDATVHMGYFMLTGDFLIKKVGIPAQWVMPVMSIGQIAEIGTMAVLGIFLKKFGWRTTMIIGILGHTARFGVFAFYPEMAPAILINVLHGICYAFFFATVYIFVDEYFPKDARASAQGLFNFLIIGIGPLVGGFLWPFIQGLFTVDGVVDYRTVFLFPSGVALFAAILLLLFFHPPKFVAKINEDTADDTRPAGSGAFGSDATGITAEDPIRSRGH